MKKAFVFFVLAMVLLEVCFAQNNVVGTWTDIEGYTWTFSADGKLKYGNNEYRFSVTDTKLMIFEVESVYSGLRMTGDQSYNISFSPDGKTLSLTNGNSRIYGWTVAGPGFPKNQLTKTANTGSISEGRVFNNARALGEYLYSQPTNSPDKPIKVSMSANNQTIEEISLVLLSSEKIRRYVSLELTGSALTSIGQGAFSNRSLASITIPNSVTSIGNYPFYGCTGLITINVSSGNNAYSSADGILYNKNKTMLIQYPAGKADSTFTIPNSVTTIGESAFAYCTNLTAINVDATNTAYSSADGVLYNKNKTTLIQYPAGKAGTFTIPNSVTSIWDAAFVGCASLTNVTIPTSVTSIGEYAFSDCTRLASVTFQGTISSSNFSSEEPFPGDLRAKYLRGGRGTYTTRNPGDNAVWTKQ